MPTDPTPHASAAGTGSHLRAGPGPDPTHWADWREWDAQAWPDRVERRFQLTATACFNCEAGCGLLAYVDQDTGEISKIEGNPLHPASRGRTCAKGPATVQQVRNPDRILYPLKRSGPRGGGQWERVDWDSALSDIAARIRSELDAERRDTIVYHVGRAGEDLYTERVLAAWGIDGHNSHTNVCSASARFGYGAWMGMDRPMPDHAHAKFILVLSAHLESGHYFNPQAQRIVEAQDSGQAKICAIDTRLSNTAAKADYWLSPWPGTEAGLLLAIASYLIREDRCDWDFMRQWVNWREFLDDSDALRDLAERGIIQEAPTTRDFATFQGLLREIYAPYTFDWAADECGIDRHDLAQVAEEVASAGDRLATHVWRNAAAGNRGGWMVARCLLFLNVLTGALGTEGGTLPGAWCKFVPRPFSMPDPVDAWSQTQWPERYPLAQFEMSFLLPHLLREQDKQLAVYFTRVYNPVWTNPDGFSWIEMLTEADRVGLHVALTPVWNESAQYADYVLPMGLGPERHDLFSYETHAAQWIGFRQPVQRVRAEEANDGDASTRQTNPGEVWEENAFWTDLSWRIDPDGTRGIRRHFESPYRPGQKIEIAEYYRWIFENSVPGLPEAARDAGKTPWQYMRERAAFEVTRDVYRQHETALPDDQLEDAVEHDGALWSVNPTAKSNLAPIQGPFRDAEGRTRIAVRGENGRALAGFPTPSGLLEFFSTTLRDWGWPEYTIPFYPHSASQRAQYPQIVSQVHRSLIDPDKNEFLLLPTFRLPTLIHSRTNGAGWLYELGHLNPIWMHPDDAARVGVETGNYARVETEIGSFVDKVWVTESIHPGIIACSHHLGRWRLHEDHGSDRWNSVVVALDRRESRWRMRPLGGVKPFRGDRDSERIWWTDGGVHQNITFPVQPDPISGQHGWHQKVVVRRVSADLAGHIEVDTAKARAAYEAWSHLTRIPDNQPLRRPYWMIRPLKPTPSAYQRRTN